MITEQFELELIQRQFNIELAINKIQQTIYDIPYKKDLILKHLMTIYNIIDKALGGNIQAINFLQGRHNILEKQKYIDDNGNIYEIQGINESTLNYQWKKFDLKYIGSLSLGHYLRGLTDHLRKKCGIKTFKIKLIKKGIKLIK